MEPGNFKSAASRLSRIGACSLYAASEDVPIAPGSSNGGNVDAVLSGSLLAAGLAISACYNVQS